MFDQQARLGAEAVKRRDALLGKYRAHVKAALGAQNPAECRVEVTQARKLFEDARREQAKLRIAQRAAIEELEKWRAGTDAVWAEVQAVAEDQLAKLEGLLESEGA